MAIKCPKCQAENPETPEFCGECGTQLPSAKTTCSEVIETLQTLIKGLTAGSSPFSRECCKKPEDRTKNSGAIN